MKLYNLTISPPIRDGLGVGLAVGLSGLAFGTTAVTAGMSVAQACVLSLLCFSGASQFALAAVVAGGGDLAAGTLGALLLGGRNALYGLRLSGELGWRGGRRIVAAHGVIDETAAITLPYREQTAVRAAFTSTFATLYLMWNLTTALGALAADSIGSPEALGIDAVGPAIFLALLWPRLTEGRRVMLVALLGAGIALATTPWLPPGVPVLLAVVAALAGTGERGDSGETGEAGPGGAAGAGPTQSREVRP
ncbi:AzlC family ABC transporter permease [Salinactinospora qingdaonensis]|uniref:4-azaleucine resistance transporter AzlC n=1 Tax=Salinactinospora qingdaonensis TaxID=702744 RepID=A0ABP7FN05_9ACTN